MVKIRFFFFQNIKKKIVLPLDKWFFLCYHIIIRFILNARNKSYEIKKKVYKLLATIYKPTV